MANVIIANVKHPSGIVGPKSFLQASVQNYATASDSGIIRGSAVAIVNGEARLARANSDATLAVGLVSSVISTTLCEVMTDGVFLGYPSNSVVREPLYLSRDAAGSIGGKPGSGIVQFIGHVISSTGLSADLKLGISGFSNVEAHQLARVIDVITGASGAVGIGGSSTPVLSPQATLHVAGGGLISGTTGATLSLSRNDNAVVDGDTLGRIDFCVTTSPGNSAPAGAIGAHIRATAAGVWDPDVRTTAMILEVPAGTCSIMIGGDEKVSVSSTGVTLEDLRVQGAVSVGGGYFLLGGTGTTLDDAGNISSNGTLTITAVSVGGGYNDGSHLINPDGTTLSSDGNISANGDLVIDGTSTLTGDVDIGGGYSANGSGITLYSTGAISANGTLTVPAVSVGGGYLNSGATLDYTGNISANGDLVIDGTSTLTGDVAIGGGYSANGSGITLYSTGAISANGDLTVPAVHVGGGYNNSGATLDHTGNISASGDLTIYRTSTLNGDIYVGGGYNGAVYIFGQDHRHGVTIYANGNISLNGTVTAADGHSHFTGIHVYTRDASVELGQAVVLVGTTVHPSSTPRARTCVGVVTSLIDSTQDSFLSGVESPKATVAAVGDNFSGELRGFLVCNENGPIAAGDLLCTSSVTGHLMKQDDDILRAYTVGKAMQDVVFAESGKASGVYGYVYCG